MKPIEIMKDHFLGMDKKGQYELFHGFILAFIVLLSVLVVVATYYLVIVGI